MCRDSTRDTSFPSLVIPIAMIVLLAALTPATGQQLDSGQQIHPVDLETFNLYVTSSVQIGEPTSLITLIDWTTLEERITSGVEGHPEVISKTLRRMRSFGHEWVIQRHAASKGGAFEFRRLMRRDGSTQALYRLIDAAGGANFYGLVLGTAADGSLRIVDFDDIMSGELYSQHARRTLTFLVDGVGSTVGEDPTPDQLAFGQSIKQVELLQSLVDMRKPLGALLVYGELPEDLRQDRHVLALRVRAARMLEPGGAKHEAAIRDLVGNRTDLQSLHGWLMDYCINAGDYKQALASAKHLRQQVGPDAWIDTQVAKIHLQSGDVNLARTVIDQAVQDEPGLVTVQLTRMEIAATQSDFAAAVESLDHADRIRRIPNLYVIESVPIFEALVRSPEFKRWKSSRTE